MTTLWVSEQGATVRSRAGKLLIENDGAILSEHAMAHVEQLFVQGNAKITTAVLHDFATRDARVWICANNGEIVAALHTFNNSYTDLLQQQIMLSKAQKLHLAKAIVLGKGHNSLHTLQYKLQHVPSSMLEALGKIMQCGSAESLLGLEGTIARGYFASLQKMLPENLGFCGRVYRPATDPVNSVLSLVYTLLLGMVQHGVLVAGLHPAFGVFHVRHGKRPALVLDLMEEYRPVVDRVVLNVFNLKQLRPEHFVYGEQGCMLQKDAKKVLYQAFYSYTAKIKLKQVIHKQVQHFAQCIRTGEEYQAWLYKR